MAGRVVAILAQVRRVLVQELVVRGAMRVVAARAVLLDRWVGEHERSALVGVAAQALVVDRCIAQHHGADGAMRIVAIGALDLAFDDRVMRRLQGLRTDVLVARATDFRFVRTEGRLERCDGRVARPPVDAVAVRARDVAQRMLARFPEGELPIRRMAGEANRRFLGGRSGFDQVGRLALGRILQVLGGIAVAGLAHGAGGVILRAVRGERDGRVLVLVAIRTDGSDVRRLGRGRRGGRRLLGEGCSAEAREQDRESARRN